MTLCNSLNVKLQIRRLVNKSQQLKNEAEVVLRLSSNMLGDNETNFLISYY